VPGSLRDAGPAYDVAQLWAKFARAIRAGSNADSTLPDFDHAVRRQRMLDVIVRACETGQRQKLAS
jgi:predicted dehydrogenase